MPRIPVPKNIGKVRVAMTLGGKFTVWNGKQGPGEFTLICRNRKEAEAIAKKINVKGRENVIEVD